MTNPSLLLAVLLGCAAGCRDRSQSAPAVVDQAADAGVEEVRYVWASRLNVRAEPSPDAERLTQLEIGTRVTVLERNAGFARIRAGEVSGWVANELLEPEPPTASDLLSRYYATPEDDLPTRRSLLERAAALSPMNTRVLEELVATLERAQDPAALDRARRGLATALFPISWDGPLLGRDAFGPACDGDAGAPSWSALLRASRGLWGRRDLVSLDAESAPVELTWSCEDARLTLSGFDEYALARESRGKAAFVQVDRLAPSSVGGCSPSPMTMDPRCTGEPPPDHESSPLPACMYECAAKKFEGGELQVFSHLVEDEEEGAATFFVEASWIRLVQHGNPGAWVELRDGPKWAKSQDGQTGEAAIAALLRPGTDVRVLLLQTARCHDAFALRMVRWLPDGRAELGRTFEFDPGDVVDELCSQ